MSCSSPLPGFVDVVAPQDLDRDSGLPEEHVLSQVLVVPQINSVAKKMQHDVIHVDNSGAQTSKRCSDVHVCTMAPFLELRLESDLSRAHQPLLIYTYLILLDYVLF